MGVRIPEAIQPQPSERRSLPLWVGIGGLGALALGFALVPLRPFTAASNLAFAFLILTIAVAELGGRGPGLVTAALVLRRPKAAAISPVAARARKATRSSACSMWRVR